jgi:DNA polymerase-3 subunit epsilon
MIVLDVETSGVDRDKHSLLSIGAVDFLKPERQFYIECRVFDGAHISEEALLVNGFSKQEAINTQKMSEAEAVVKFLEWALKSEIHTIGGQNPFFDVSFIQKGAERASIDFPLAHRILDLHSIVYFHMMRRGITPPVKNGRSNINSDTIMEYVGIGAEPKPHNALNGAIWEAEAFSRLLYNK